MVIKILIQAKSKPDDLSRIPPFLLIHRHCRRNTMIRDMPFGPLRRAGPVFHAKEVDLMGTEPPCQLIDSLLSPADAVRIYCIIDNTNSHDDHKPAFIVIISFTFNPINIQPQSTFNPNQHSTPTNTQTPISILLKFLTIHLFMPRRLRKKVENNAVMPITMMVIATTAFLV